MTNCHSAQDIRNKLLIMQLKKVKNFQPNKSERRKWNQLTHLDGDLIHTSKAMQYEYAVFLKKIIKRIWYEMLLVNLPVTKSHWLFGKNYKLSYPANLWIQTVQIIIVNLIYRLNLWREMWDSNHKHRASQRIPFIFSTCHLRNKVNRSFMSIPKVM